MNGIMSNLQQLCMHIITAAVTVASSDHLFLCLLAAPRPEGGTVSAELLAQKRAALGSPDGPDSDQPAGTTCTEQSKPAIVGIVIPDNIAKEHADVDQPSSSGPAASASASAPESSSAAVDAGPADQMPATGSRLTAGTGLTLQQADGMGKNTSAPRSTLPFQQLCLTFQHGAPLPWLLYPQAFAVKHLTQHVWSPDRRKLIWLLAFLQCGTVWTCQKARTCCKRNRTSSLLANPSCIF
jgi:hypothetical protein